MALTIFGVSVYYITNGRVKISFIYGNFPNQPNHDSKMIHILILSLIFASYFGIEYVVDYFIFPGRNTRSIHAGEQHHTLPASNLI